MPTPTATITADTAPVVIASWATPLVVLHNTGAAPVYVGDVTVTPGTGTVIAAGATVEIGLNGRDGNLYLVAAEPTDVEVTRYTSPDDFRDRVSAETGVPVELLLTARTEADMRDLADRLNAWKAAA